MLTLSSLSVALYVSLRSLDKFRSINFEIKSVISIINQLIVRRG
uniref:Uncharacterized protein n=1 Tax=Arundo donax TaxID=35708 RepID=A0A0A9FQS7_ARUDO